MRRDLSLVLQLHQQWFSIFVKEIVASNCRQIRRHSESWRKLIEEVALQEAGDCVSAPVSSDQGPARRHSKYQRRFSEVVSHGNRECRP